MDLETDVLKQRPLVEAAREAGTTQQQHRLRPWSQLNFGFWILDFGLAIGVVPVSASNRKSKIQNRKFKGQTAGAPGRARRNCSTRPGSGRAGAARSSSS